MQFLKERVWRSFILIMISTNVLWSNWEYVKIDSGLSVLTFAIQTASYSHLNSPPPPWQNGRHFADGISRCIFVNEKFYILIEMSLTFVPNGPIDNNPALVWIMTWRQAIILTNADPIHWRIYAVLCGLTHLSQVKQKVKQILVSELDQHWLPVRCQSISCTESEDSKTTSTGKLEYNGALVKHTIRNVKIM